MAFDVRLLNGIDVLTAVVKGGSFVQAAEARGVTSAAISRAVTLMEQRIDILLLRRAVKWPGISFARATTRVVIQCMETAVGSDQVVVLDDLALLVPHVLGDHAFAANISHCAKSLNCSLSFVCARIVRRSFRSLRYFSRNSARITRPSSRNAK